MIHKVTVQMFHGSENVESPCLLLDSGNMHTQISQAHRMTILTLLSSWDMHPSIHFPLYYFPLYPVLACRD